MNRRLATTFTLASSCVVALVLSLTSAAPASAAGTGLVLGYGAERFGPGVVLDSSPSGLNGTLLGSPAGPGTAASVKGHGSALSFDSTQHQFVDAGSAAPLDVDHFTLAAWVRYLPVVHDDRWEILEKAGAYWMNIRTDTRRLRVGGFFGGCTGGPSQWKFLDSKKVLPASTWLHVAGTYDGKTLKIYIGGVLDNSLAVSGQTCVNTSPLGIGAKNRTATGVVEAYFDGRIDDLRVYDRALSGAEIRAAKAAALT